MRLCSEIIPDYRTAFHYKADALKLGDVRQRITAYGNEIRKLAGLNGTDTVFPSQHFCPVDSESADYIESRHSGLAEVNKSQRARLPARFPWIKPTHVRSSGILHA
jgi:hypothetical protein